MNILYITQLLPFPLDAGGKIKTYATLRAIARKHNVFLAAFTQKRGGRADAVRLKKQLGLKRVFTLFHPVVAEVNFRQHLWTMVRSIPTPFPYAVYKFFHPAMKRHIDAIVSATRFDCVWIDHASMIPYLPQKIPARILEMHNAEHVLYARVAKEEARIHWKLFFFLESLKYKRFLARALGAFDHVFAISRTDKNALDALCPTTISVLPPAIPAARAGKKHHGPPSMLFVGLLTWYPNKMGVRWYIDKVAPIIRKKIPEATTIVVGQYARAKFFRPPSDVRLVGYAKSLQPHIRRASVCIVPLHSGSGVRIKILEAMAHGVPVVSTTIGAEGIEATDEKIMMIADTPEDFAQAVISLLKNEDFRHRTAVRARAWVRKHFSQHLVNQKAEEVLISVAHHGSSNI